MLELSGWIEKQLQLFWFGNGNGVGKTTDDAVTSFLDNRICRLFRDNKATQIENHEILASSKHASSVYARS